jgi:SAM-dependent methyltransferase
LYSSGFKTDRQYGPTLDFIRRDHTQRYFFAANRLRGRKVLDLACGCGYGSWILHQAGNEVTGVDIEAEAITYAKRHYEGPTYLNQPGEETKGEFDALVTFETLEHLANPESVLAVQAPLVIASVPNEERYPFIKGNFADDKYPHLRHYTPEEFEGLLESAGFKVRERFCQPTKLGEIVEGTDGLFLIYVANR